MVDQESKNRRRPLVSSGGLNIDQLRCVVAIALTIVTIPLTVAFVAVVIIRKYVLGFLSWKKINDKDEETDDTVKTFLLTGGKMSKALMLARALKRSKGGKKIKV